LEAAPEKRIDNTHTDGARAVQGDQEAARAKGVSEKLRIKAWGSQKHRTAHTGHSPHAAAAPGKR
jgi:hypothetical protein